MNVLHPTAPNTPTFCYLFLNKHDFNDLFIANNVKFYLDVQMKFCQHK